MLSSEQIDRLIQENEHLQAQLKELTMILAEREEELELLKANTGDSAELRSRLDLQLDEFQSMQNVIGEKQQQVEGAAEREAELERELLEAMQMQQLYDDLLQEYAHSQAQLQDIQEQMLELHHKNRLLQESASRVGELESDLANTTEERDLLKYRLSLSHDSKNHSRLNSDKE